MSAVQFDLVGFLTSPAAAPALAELAARLPAEGEALATLERLRRTFTAEEAAALLSQARLRTRAVAKFPAVDGLLYEANALEQATAWPVALLRAERLHQLAPPGPLLDLGCGIGGDLLALARFRPVIAYESDPQRAALATHNAQAAALPFAVEVRCADWVEEMRQGQLPAAVGAFADPARRRDDRRLFGLAAMQPPLSALLELRGHLPLLAVKVAPGVRDEELPPACALQFVSHERSCKEAVLWLAAERVLLQLPRRWASVWDGAAWHELAASRSRAPVGEVAAGQTLYEADPAAMRAGTLAELCAHLGAHLFDPEIAWLVAPAPVQAPGPLVTPFAIEEVHRFGLKLLNRRLAALGVGRVEIKKRGFPVEPEDLRTQLRLVPGGREAVVFLTRRRSEHLMLIGRRAPAASG